MSPHTNRHHLALFPQLESTAHFHASDPDHILLRMYHHYYNKTFPYHLSDYYSIRLRIYFSWTKSIFLVHVSFHLKDILYKYLHFLISNHVHNPDPNYKLTFKDQ